MGDRMEDGKNKNLPQLVCSHIEPSLPSHTHPMPTNAALYTRRPGLAATDRSPGRPRTRSSSRERVTHSGVVPQPVYPVAPSTIGKKQVFSLRTGSPHKNEDASLSGQVHVAEGTAKVGLCDVENKSAHSRRTKELSRLAHLRHMHRSRTPPQPRRRARGKSPHMSLLEATAVHGLGADDLERMSLTNDHRPATAHSVNQQRRGNRFLEGGARNTRPSSSMTRSDTWRASSSRISEQSSSITNERGVGMRIGNPADVLERFQEGSPGHTFQMVDTSINISLSGTCTATCHVCGRPRPLSAISRTSEEIDALVDCDRIDAGFVPRTPQNVQAEDVDWEAKWNKTLQMEMQNFHSVELLCSAMLTQMDIHFPASSREQPNYLRVAAALDLLDIITPVLGSFQPIVSRLRDEVVRAIYMPERAKASHEASIAGHGGAKQPSSIRLNTLKPLTEQRDDDVRKRLRQQQKDVSAKGCVIEGVRDGTSYFARTPYFKSGIRTVNDNIFLRNMDSMVRSLENQVQDLKLNIAELETEKSNLEKRIEGFQMRTLTMELELESNVKKWEKKEAALLKEIDSLENKLVLGVTQASNEEHKSSPRRQDSPNLASESSAPRSPMPPAQVHRQQTTVPLTMQDAEAAEKQREKETQVLGILRMLSDALVDVSRKMVEGVCNEIRTTTHLFKATPTIRMLLKSGESSTDMDRISRSKAEEVLVRWISAHLKQAFMEGRLPEGATVQVNNLTADLDDGTVMVDFINLVLPDRFKWSESKMQDARHASLAKRGELFANAMVDLTSDTEWENIDLFHPDSAPENRIRFLSLLFLISSGITGGEWGTGQQIATNFVTVQDTAEKIENGAEKLSVALDAAASRSSPLSALGPSTGQVLCEAVKNLIANSGKVRTAVSTAVAELKEMQESTAISQRALQKLFSAKFNSALKRALNTCKQEFERGLDAGFEEAKQQQIVHINMQRQVGLSQEFSRNRLRSGFGKLLLGNLNKERFEDISVPELAKGISPEQFVRWMEELAGATLQHYNAIDKIFRCYGTLQDEDASGASKLTHPTCQGITIRVGSWMKLMHDSDLLRLDHEQQKEKITALKALFIFQMACRPKYFHTVQDEPHATPEQIIRRVEQAKDNTLNLPSFIEALSRISWTIIRQLSDTTISNSTVETVFKAVTTRCHQLNVDHFLACASTAHIKDLLRPAVETALRKYAGTDQNAVRKSRKSLGPSEFARMLIDCKLYDVIGSEQVGWCFWRIDHSVEEEEEEWGPGTAETGHRRLASTAIHRSLCCVSCFLLPDPLV